MKTKLFGGLLALLLGLTSVFVPSVSQAQPRNSGRLVVPIGYESFDSIRFSIWTMEEARDRINWILNNSHAYLDTGYIGTLMNSWADSLQATFEGDFSDIGPGANISGKRKGIACGMSDPQVPFTQIASYAKARTFYPSPFGPESFLFDSGYYWRYNDVNFASVTHATWHNNTYDANDISPYCEYPKNDSIVTATDTTRTYNNSGDTVVHYGDRGRVILGYSDDRLADQLLHVHPSAFLHSDAVRDTARTFSVNLDFNIADGPIDTALASGRPDRLLPLVTLQVLFKRGSAISPPDPGQPILPFVPFADSSHLGNPGWYKVAEVVVNKHMYDSLDYSWKCEDTLQNGTVSHPWRFKQLHVILKDIPTAMRQLIKADTNDDFGIYGQGSGASPLTLQVSPDSLVAAVGSELRDKPYLEIRVLSTYRDTVRVRGLDYHDTLVDKFLYRKRIAGTLDSTHSCNPDGSIGGYDDTIRGMVNNTSVAHAGLTREFLINDTPPTNGNSGGLSAPMVAYLDFMGSKGHIHAHWREQDSAGKNVLQFRRLRMQFDGEPPSMFENQVNVFLRHGIFPQDYLYYTALDSASVTWPSYDDSIVGMVIGRKCGSDSLKAYRAFTAMWGGLNSFVTDLRQSTKTALWHPNAKRMAIEAAVQGWAGILYPAGTFNPSTQRWSAYDTTLHVLHYNTKGFNQDSGYWELPTTPEETIGQGFLVLAEGLPCFNIAQGIDASDPTGGAPGVLGIDPWDTNTRASNYHLAHDRNVGHEYTWRNNKLVNGETFSWPNPATPDVSGDLPPFYLGYSNNWRAYRRLLSRLNAIYDSTDGRRCPHPYKYLTWQDAYSTNRTDTSSTVYSQDDNTSRHNAFLKVLCTRQVDPWNRAASGAYVDLATYDTLKNTFVEVGLFKDSISSSLVNRAAILVNTRFWPSLRDPEDSAYYNQGLDSLKDHCRSTLGDIDVRKVYMTIDTNQVESSFRSPYYVVRDLWHPDTCWLVKCDSQFAVYIKPGDAKFLYFEKAIAITAAPTAASDLPTGMTMNNGHRVAERANGGAQVVAYTRNAELYVSQPAKGRRFSGSAEQSGGDNIATGPEITGKLNGAGGFALGTFDTATCFNPSVATGFNDSSVALVYFVADTVNRVRVAWQPHPDSAWKVATYYGAHFTVPSEVTPVVTPLGMNQFAVFAVHKATSPSDSERIQVFRFSTGTSITFNDPVPLSVVAAKDSTGLALPSVASRPNLTYGSAYPIRLLWESGGQIYYRQVGFDIGGLIATTVEQVSNGLNGCAHIDPQIQVFPYWAITYGYLGLLGWIPTSVKYTEADAATWEVDQFIPGTPFFPVLRIRNDNAGMWGPFQVFRPSHGTVGSYGISLHYPTLSVAGFDYLIYDSLSGAIWKRLAIDSDQMRMTINNDNSAIDVFSEANDHWTRGSLQESGNIPSTPLRTDSVNGRNTYYYFGRGLNPLVYQGSTSPYAVRITNAELPDIRTDLVAGLKLGIQLLPLPCQHLQIVITLNPPIHVTPEGPVVRQFVTNSMPDSSYVMQGSWPSTSRERAFKFLYHEADSIYIPRLLTVSDTAPIFGAFSVIGDSITLKIQLLRFRDSAVIATLDSMAFARVPGSGIGYRDTVIAPLVAADSFGIHYKIPTPTATDTGIIAVSLTHTAGVTSLQKSVVFYFMDSLLAPGSYKKSAPVQSVGTSLSMTLYPNPTHSVTWIELGAPAELHVNLELYDLMGRKVQTLYDAETPQSGKLHLVLNASALTSGSYFLRATAGNEVLTRRIELVK